MANFFKSLFKGKAETEESNKNEKKNFDIFKYDGMRAQRMGRADYAMKCFVSALEIEEDFETMSYLSQLYILKDDLDSAAQLLERMIELEPAMINTYLVLANVYFMQENYQGMADLLNKAIETDDKNAAVYYMLGKADWALKQDIQAVANLTKAITLKSDESEEVYIDALLLRAEVLLHMKQYEEALSDVTRILQQVPEEETALLLHGKINEETDNTEEAETIYRKVTELNPFSEKAYISLGQLYISQKKFAEAIELLDEAVELNPNSAQAYHERGRAKLLNNDKDGSVEDMKKALELNPKEGQAVSGEFNNQNKEPQSSIGLNF